jgi:hypothetical protein
MAKLDRRRRHRTTVLAEQADVRDEGAREREQYA